MPDTTKEAVDSDPFRVSRFLASQWGDWGVAAFSMACGWFALLALRADNQPLAAGILFFSATMTGVLLYASSQRRLQLRKVLLADQVRSEQAAPVMHAEVGGTC